MKQSAKATGGSEVSWETWTRTWQELASEFETLESECAEEHSKIAELVESTSDGRDSPLSASVGLWTWMDECLWEGLVKLRTEVKSGGIQAAELLEENPPSEMPSELRSHKAAKLQGRASELKPKLEEFKAQHEHLTSVLDHASVDLESLLRHFEERCSGWVMEPSTVAWWSPPCCGVVPTVAWPGPSPPWRGVRGGDGSWHTGIDVRASPGLSPLVRQVKSQAERSKDMENDIVLRKLREATSALEQDIRQAGGLTGGWSEVDHEIFQRIFRMYRKHPSPLLNDRLAERLPGLSMDQIVAHVDWFIEFEERQCTKRRLFAEWRDRMAELDQEAAEAQELFADKENRRKEGLKRSRILQQRRKVTEWRQARQQTEEEAEAAQRRLKLEKTRRKKEEARKQLEAKMDQRRALDKFREERAAALVAERQAEAARSENDGVSPEVRRKIKSRNSALLKKLNENAQAMRRAHSEPSLKIPKKHAYDHIESNVYASTAAFSQRVAARCLTEPVESEYSTTRAARNQKEWRVYNAWLGAALSKEQAVPEFGDQPFFTITEPDPPEAWLLAESLNPEPPTTFEAVD